MPDAIPASLADRGVLVVEDHLTVRRGIELVLRASGMRIAGTAADVDEALRLATARRPAVALVDLELPSGTGLDLARRMRELTPDTAVLLYTGWPQAVTAAEIEASGAVGLVLKSAAPDVLTAALVDAATGGSVELPRLAPHPSEALSQREREVVALLADGLSGEEIAERLTLSPETVRTHVRNAQRKLGARSRAQLVAMSLRRG